MIFGCCGNNAEIFAKVSVRGNILAFPLPEVTMAPIVIVLVNKMITLFIVKMTLTSERDKMQTQLAAHIKPSFSALGSYSTFRDKKYCIMTFQDKIELYYIVLQQYNAPTSTVLLTIAL